MDTITAVRNRQSYTMSTDINSRVPHGTVLKGLRDTHNPFYLLLYTGLDASARPVITSTCSTGGFVEKSIRLNHPYISALLLSIILNGFKPSLNIRSFHFFFYYIPKLFFEFRIRFYFQNNVFVIPRNFFIREHFFKDIFGIFHVFHCLCYIA